MKKEKRKNVLESLFVVIVSMIVLAIGGMVFFFSFIGNLRLKKITSVEKAEEIMNFKDKKGKILFSLERGSKYGLDILGNVLTFMYFGCHEDKFKFRASRNVIEQVKKVLEPSTSLHEQGMYRFR